MAHLTIRWTSRALLRLDHSAAHIQKDSPQAAARVVSRIVTAVDLLAEQPGMGRIGRIKTTHELVLPDISYIIPYRVTDTHVDILTVMHAAQKWPEEL